MKKLLIATNNAGKTAEIKAIFTGLYDEVVSLKDMGLNLNTIEDGETFEANALKKAREGFEASGIDTLADDSGLCVDALYGHPGVYSARYAGEHATDQENYQKLLREMADVIKEERTARFTCTVALVRAGKPEIVTVGKCEGTITEAPSGYTGFGYDPCFFVEEYGRTMAELSAEEKNAISHRGKALQKLKQILTKENE
ncbi:MAG: XTP/dITP diphosphatase [Eubacteriales bacterium]